MKPKIVNLVIENFRAFKRLELKGLGRVNLITGRNNTGKSSVLEALRILASNATPNIIWSILNSREEVPVDKEDSSEALIGEGVFYLSGLFHGFPRLSDKFSPITMEFTNDNGDMKLSVAISQESTLFDDQESPLRLQIDVDGNLRELSLSSYQHRSLALGRILHSHKGDDFRWPCEFVSPYGGERTATLAPLWDRVALSDQEKDIVDALRIIDPRIEAVSMIGGEGPRRTRTAIVRAKGLPRPVPLRSFGDGLNRLFGMILSLVNAKDGLLLIDEFENGMHYTVQADAWKVIFELATRLKVQVMAISHSWDTIETFQRVACDHPEEGVLVRLSRKGDEIVPTLFREDELAVATRDRIELR